MADYVTLLGAEEVARAGYQMRDAAQQMRSAAGDMDESLRRHQMFMTDWLQQFTAVVEKLSDISPVHQD